MDSISVILREIEYLRQKLNQIAIDDVRQAASLKAGGQGWRYTCKIAEKQVLLFCDEGKWFIER